jgi:hypothetical protein
MNWNEDQQGISSDDWRWLIRDNEDGTFSVRDYVEEEWLKRDFLTVEDAKNHCETVHAQEVGGLPAWMRYGDTGVSDNDLSL